VPDVAWQLSGRLGILVLSLLAASLLIFLVVQVLPGDPAQVVLGVNATPEALAQLRHQMGLDLPGWERYLLWLAGMAHGDFGTSQVSGAPVADLVLQKLAVSVPLAVLGMFVALAVAVPLGVVAGVRYRRVSGTVISALSLGGVAIPAFWGALLLITVFAIRLHVLPAGGFVPWSDDPAGALRSLLLPAVSLGLVQGAILTRYIRSAIVDVLREDYIRTARANGLTQWQALRRHGFRNAAIPIVTVLGLQLTSLLVGAVVIENVFFLPGLGRMLLQAIGNRDLIVIQATVMLLTGAVLVVNFLVDVSYRLLDPRIRAAR
jgi:peptide/nickel transport system permease protein